jgi:hypothetical protein
MGPSLGHGRIATRRIWTTTALNDDLDFPHVGQTFVGERECIEKKSRKSSIEVAYGITSRTPDQSPAKQVCSKPALTRPPLSMAHTCPMARATGHCAGLDEETHEIYAAGNLPKLEHLGFMKDVVAEFLQPH